MNITPIRTERVIPGSKLFEIFDNHIQSLNDGDILVVTSKIVSICEGSVIKNDGKVKKEDLLKKYSQRYILPSSSKYDVSLSITHNILVASAGIDESNGNGYYILWPVDPYKSASEIRVYLRNKFSLKNLGVIITDSVVVPLRWGTRGIGIAYCGFEPLRDYRGMPDIFGRNLMYTKLSLLDGLAASAVVTMGEGNEQTPIAVIRNVKNIVYTDHPPTKDEIAALTIEPEEDLFAPIVKYETMKKGSHFAHSWATRDKNP